MKELYNKYIKIISLGLISGFIIGLGNFTFEIIGNNYIQYKMFRIIIHSLYKFLNKWVLSFFILFLLFFIIFYIILPFTIFLIKMLWKSLLSDTISIQIKQKNKFIITISALISCSVFLFLGGWAINHYWLPYIFHPISILGNIAILLFTLVLGYILLKINWLILFKIIHKKYIKIIEIKFIPKLAFYSVMSLIIINLFVLFDNKIKSPKGPNIIFICIDALRADHLGCYGYKKETSPHIDQIAKNSIMFTNAMSQSSWTKTSTASFMTSNNKILNMINEEDKLPLNTITLAEILKNQGYTTGGFIPNPWLLPEFGFEQGFDYYNTKEVHNKRRRIKEEDIFKYIKKNKNNKFFLYIHFMDVHNPYNPPSPYNKMFTSNNGRYIYNNGLINISAEDLIHTKGLYDGEIRFLDEKIHNLFNHLKELNILNRTMLIINSDHGEEFMDHNGMGHGTTLYNELINVPLIIHVPPIIDNYKNIKKSVIHSRVRNIDILPTILDALKISQNTSIDGVSLLPFIFGEEDSSSPLPSLASVKSEDTEDILTSISRDRYKYIHNITQKTSELYNLQNDPKESENLIKSMPEIAHKMHEEILSLKLNYYGPSSNGSTKTSIDKKTIEKLKSLGYF